MVIVGTNSWVTIAYANSYFSERFGGDSWAALSLIEKTQLLITAFNWIRAKAQISKTATDENVLHAQCELALYLFNHYASHDKRSALYAQGVRSFNLSKFSETLQKPDLPDGVKDLLEDYLGEGGQFFTIEREND
jgi:hypothetical protein